MKYLYIAHIGLLYKTYNTLYINILLFQYTLYTYLIICSISYVAYNRHVKNDFSRLFRFQVVIIIIYVPTCPTYIPIYILLLYNIQLKFNIMFCDEIQFCYCHFLLRQAQWFYKSCGEIYIIRSMDNIIIWIPIIMYSRIVDVCLQVRKKCVCY